MYISESADQSFYTLGGYDTTGTHYDGTIKWIDVSDTFFWIVPAFGAKVGTKVLLKKQVEMVVDSGTSLAYLPWYFTWQLAKQITKHTWRKKLSDGLYYTSCDLSLFPPV